MGMLAANMHSAMLEMACHGHGQLAKHLDHPGMCHARQAQGQVSPQAICCPAAPTLDNMRRKPSFCEVRMKPVACVMVGAPCAESSTSQMLNSNIHLQRMRPLALRTKGWATLQRPSPSAQLGQDRCGLLMARGHRCERSNSLQSLAQQVWT